MANNNHGTLFLNKIIQTEDFGNFAKFGITEESFVSAADRETYRFIADYHAKYGDMPSYATVAGGVQSFVYVPNITDRFEPLVEGINDRKMAVEFNKVFEQDFDRIKRESGGDTGEIISQLTESLSDIRMRYTNTRSVGVDLKRGADEFLTEYEKRKAGESFTTWKSFMPFLNEETGGYSTGNMTVVYGRSGRGKSAVVLRETVELAEQGATVLLWSLEMPSYEVMTRLYSMVSAKLGLTSIKIKNDDGETLQIREGGFSSGGLRSGGLGIEQETSLKEMLAEMNDHLEGNIIIRGVDDVDFQRRDLGQLEADIRATNADCVVIDPFYYLDYEKNTSKTAGGDAAETSKKLRRLAGQLNVAVIAMTQADEDESGEGGEERELKLPKRSEVSKTKQLLQDASTLLAVDTNNKQGRGMVQINKGRFGGEDSRCELTFIPVYGVIEQLELDGDLFNIF